MTIKQSNATPAEAAAEDARRNDPAAVSDRARKADEAVIQRAMMLPMAYLFVELVDYLLANTAMSATDFTPAQRTLFNALKTAVDRRKP